MGADFEPGAMSLAGEALDVITGGEGLAVTMGARDFEPGATMLPV